jgi:hypothetical protein
MRMKPILAAIAFAFSANAVFAQAPSINAVWPPGGMRGSKVTARIEGGNLAGFQSMLVSGVGVKATAAAGDGGQVPVTLEIAPDAGPGPYEVRVTTAKGVSNPAYLWVGAFA